MKKRIPKIKLSLVPELPKVPNLQRKLLERARKLLAIIPLHSLSEISVSILPDTMMAAINQEFLSHEGTTDVITFDYRQGEPPLPSGEVLIGYEVAVRESRKRNIPLFQELTLYIAHGFLHLAGYDDLSPSDRKKMRQAEKNVLQWLHKSTKNRQ